MADHSAMPATVASVSAVTASRSSGMPSNVLAFRQPSGEACTVTWHTGIPAFSEAPGDTVMVVPRSPSCGLPLIPSEVGDPVQTFAPAAALMVGELASIKLWTWLARRSPRAAVRPMWPLPVGRRHDLARGSIVDLITPFDGDGIDERGFADLAAWQISQGSNGLATCTTTGEGPTLTFTEKERLIRICVEVSNGRVPVIAATGTNGTDGTIALTRIARDAGADAALVVTPYYNRPSQEGIYRHFEAVARAVDIPIIVHNVPARTGVDLLPATLARLSRVASIVGICDPGGDALRSLVTARVASNRFVQLCGEDARAVAFNLATGNGCISAVANLLPGACAALQRACLEGHHVLARDIHLRLVGLMEALGSDPGPAPFKAAMRAVRSGFEVSYRLPMVAGTHEAERAVTAALESLLADPFWVGVAFEEGHKSDRSQPSATGT